MKRKMMSVMLASLIMTGCGSSHVSEVAESVETTVTMTTPEEIETTTTTTTITVTTERTTTTATEQTTTTIPEPTDDDAGGEYDVERGFFVTTFRFPASMLSDNISDNDWILSREIDGDTAIIKVKTSEYNKWIKEAIEDTKRICKETADEENDSIVEITTNDNATEYYAYVTSEEEYNQSFDSLKLMGLMLGAEISRSIFGISDGKLHLHIIDNQTGNEFYSEDYPKEES